MTTEQKAAKLLAGLGDSPAEIAAMLRGAGYKGLVGDPTSCPCGACLSDHLGEKIFVNNDGCRVAPWDLDVVGKHAPQVRAFITRFDKGGYKYLLEKK